jgi:asparagine synthase (glutamine-hydrolysing)
MFVLLAGPGAAASAETLGTMAEALRGGVGPARVWRAEERDSAAASVAPDFVPEDVFDSQPMVGEERVFVCQARIDNRGELLERLGLATDAAIADSGLLALAYDRWGVACVDRIVGDFAFAAWTRGKGRVEAAVDPIGARRLYWTRIGRTLALSPQLRPLLAHPQVSREPDLEALARMLDSGIERSSTPYAGISALPGGHRLTWAGGELRVERWWRPDWRPTVWHRDARDYVEEARELFMTAVKAQLRSRGPLSTTLSGGLDSGAVTAAAAGLLSPAGDRLTAYTWVPEPGLATFERPNWDSDDSQYARAVAAACPNVEHRLVVPGARSVLETAALVHRNCATPSKNATNLLPFDVMATAMAADGSRILLTGQQGNSAFSWRGQSAVRELAALGRWRGAHAQARLEAQGRGTALWRIYAEAGREALSSLRHRTVGIQGFNPGLRFMREGRRPPPAVRSNEYAEVRGTRRFWGVAVTTPRHVWWPEPVAQWGVELRDPTADRRLIERLLQFPQSAFRAGGRLRGLARELSRGLLPDEVRLRSSQGAQVPEAASLIALHSAAYRAALETMRAAPACRELFDLEAVGAAVDGLAAGSNDHVLALAVNRALDVGTFLARPEHRS